MGDLASMIEMASLQTLAATGVVTGLASQKQVRQDLPTS
jgi:hypothetical protein